MNKEKNYFVTANSCYGRKNMLESNLYGLTKLFIITGEHEKFIHRLIKHIKDAYVEKGHFVECIHSSYEPQMLDGIIIPAIKTGYISNTLITKDFNLDETSFNIQKIQADFCAEISPWDKQTISVLKDEYKRLYNAAYKKLSAAKIIHDEWEEIYIKCFNKRQANEFIRQFINSHIYNKNKNEYASGHSKHRFLGCGTYLGSVDFVENITAGITKRYFIKGRPGTGKSTFMKRINDAANAKGYDTEVYHCGFDTQSLDMVIIPALDFCIFDSTAPHEYSPSKKNDAIIDMYQSFVMRGTDERYGAVLSDISSRYSKNVKEGTLLMKEAKSVYDKMNDIIVKSYDEAEFNKTLAKIDIE